MKLGYHPATYKRHDVPTDDAIADISATGWDGFEWSPGAFKEHFDAPGEYKAYLNGLDLEVTGLYCPCAFRTEEEVSEWQKRVDDTVVFAKAIDCQFIMFDGGSTDLPVNSESVNKVAALSNEGAARVVAAGLTCTWHQHWGSLFQYSAEFDALMDATDPELLRCTPDTAQMALGGFDIPAAFEKYVGRMDYVHFKDLDDDRRFIELGRGNVDFPPLAKILTDAGFDGWIIVDLDYTSLDPKESSRINLGYLHKELNLTGRRM